MPIFSSKDMPALDVDASPSATALVVGCADIIACLCVPETMQGVAHHSQLNFRAQHLKIAKK